MNFKNLFVSISFMLSMIANIDCACAYNRSTIQTTSLHYMGASTASPNGPKWNGCTCCFRSGTTAYTVLKCTSNYYINSKICPTNTLSCQWCGGVTSLGMDLTKSSCCVVKGQKGTCSWR